MLECVVKHDEVELVVEVIDRGTSQRCTRVEDPVAQTTLTRRYTERALAFIERNRERPFFFCSAMIAV